MAEIVLVCGGRNFRNRKLLFNVLDKLDEHRGIRCIISGCAEGADTLALEWAGNLWTKRFPADWDRHGKAAGPIRNQQMLDESRPTLVVAFPGGRGTADMVRRAQAAGIETIQITEPSNV